MRQLYARVFTQILDSSLAENWQARHVFEDFLKLADDGIVDMTREAIARRTNLPLEVVNSAITVLEDPDPKSRDAAEEGRRIVRLDEHRDWGWRIVNWCKYEDIKSSLDQRERTRERVRKFREKERCHTSPAKPESHPEAATQLQRGYTALQDVTSSPNDDHSETDPRRADKPCAANAGAIESRPSAKLSDSEWIAQLNTDPAYQDIDVGREYAKMVRWCETNRKQPTRRRFINWLNRADRPLAVRPVGLNMRPDHRKGF